MRKIPLTTLETHRCFGGVQGIYSHASNSTGTEMRFSVFVPDTAKDKLSPVVYVLSGLTCTEANFTTKAGAQRYASELGLILVAPDTSPRGEGVPDDEGWDFGQGASFYVDATEAPWNTHFQMETYIVSELPALIASHFPIDSKRQGITGHSMGGHGALVLAMRHPETYQSVSALAPISSPMNCPWGHKAMGGYLGADSKKWAAYDACALLRDRGWHSDILVDQGDADNFLAEQLKPAYLQDAANDAKVPMTLRIQPGHDHSFYFVASMIGEHLAWHAARLQSSHD